VIYHRNRDSEQFVGHLYIRLKLINFHRKILELNISWNQNYLLSRYWCTLLNWLKMMSSIFSVFSNGKITFEIIICQIYLAMHYINNNNYYYCGCYPNYFLFFTSFIKNWIIIYMLLCVFEIFLYEILDCTECCNKNM
jgi:hypothetical protein